MYFPEFFYSFFPFPKLSYILCLFFNNILQIQEEEHGSVILLSSDIFNIHVFQNPINCKYGSSSSYGKGGSFKDM